MIYNAGTISFSGNTVTGSGTSFTSPSSQIRIGQTLLVASNPVQLVQITAINSATSLTVTPAASPAVSDQRYGIFVTDSLSVDGLAQSISQLINQYDENISAWETFASTKENQMVTVTINGASFNIPAAGGLARKGDNSDITSMSGLTTPLSRSQGGTGSSSPFGNTAGSFTQGNDERLNTINNKTGGTVTGSTRILSATFYITPPADVGGWASSMSFTANDLAKSVMATIYSDNYGAVSIQTGVLQSGGKLNRFETNGNFSTQGNISCVSLTQTSDATKKEKITPIQDPLEKIAQIEGVTFNWLDTGVPSAGVIAQQLMEVLPEAIGSVFDDHDRYEQIEEINEQGETVLVNKLVHARDDSKRSYTVEYAGVVALCVQAIKALNEKVGQLERAAADSDPG